MNRGEVATLLALAEVLWPNNPLRGAGGKRADFVVDAWILVVGHLPADAAMAALRLHRGEFPPSAGSLAEATEALLPGALTVDQVLSEISTQIHRVGWCGKPEWTEPAIGELVRALSGWEHVCAMGTDYLRRDVINLWPQVERRRKSEIALGPMAEQFAGLLRSEPGEKRPALES